MVTFEIVLRLADGSGPETRQAFSLEPGQQIVFGRNPDGDIVVPDQNRTVSSRHGRIACFADGTLRGYDMASLNGTYLDGQALDTEIGGVLGDGARLRVGDFDLRLLLQPVETASNNHRTPQQSFAAHRAPLALDADSASLVEELERAYADALAQDVPSRTSQLTATLTKGLATLPADRRDRAANALHDRFLPAGTQPAGTTESRSRGEPNEAGAEAPPAPAPAAPGAALPTERAEALKSLAKDPDNQTQVDYLQQLAHRLAPEVQLADDADRSRFATLVAQLCEASLTWLARSLESRSAFGQEFGAEVTLVFQRSSNPLKAMSQRELQEYLLDWTNAASAETRLTYFEGVLDDLHEHFVGVLAGVEQAVAGVLARLSPERIEALAVQQKAKGWTAATRAWQAYIEMHRELTQERSKLFQELISPAIQKGYLNQHDARHHRADLTDDPSVQ